VTKVEFFLRHLFFLHFIDESATDANFSSQSQVSEKPFFPRSRKFAIEFLGSKAPYCVSVKMKRERKQKWMKNPTTTMHARAGSFCVVAFGRSKKKKSREVFHRLDDFFYSSHFPFSLLFSPAAPRKTTSNFVARESL
jgi:hypothetical protein